MWVHIIGVIVVAVPNSVAELYSVCICQFLLLHRLAASVLAEVGPGSTHKLELVYLYIIYCSFQLSSC